jgi:L-rhamnose isomerase/sugar isomerase
MGTLSDADAGRLQDVLDGFRIETPSWGYADTGTRFGKFLQDEAAIDLADKLADAGQVHRVTGCCPTVAVHVLWDFAPGTDPAAVREMASRAGVAVGSVNPNLFQDQTYKFGSLANPDPAVRDAALRHCLDSVRLAREVGSDTVSLWLADGTNYPGQDSVRARKHRIEDALRDLHGHLADDQVLLVEYKPFEPAFYQTDIADWGMALHFARSAGPRARVLVDTGHHYLAQNIEQIVAWLLDEGMLGGFHFNDRRYADDDLTLGSIDPYQVFRIFNEIFSHAATCGSMPEIAYMVAQSHNLKPKTEAMVQTATTAQELFAKAALVDHPKLADLQRQGRIIDAEIELKRAFGTDVELALRAWRAARGLPADPLAAHRESGYSSNAAADRKKRRSELGAPSATTYA